VRILFVFDPWRQAILLTAGDKSTDWKGWYGKALEDAERLYAEHCVHRYIIKIQSKTSDRVRHKMVRKWYEVRDELFAGRDEEISAAEEQLRDEIRAYRLAEIRKTRHLTQQQVASEMGVSTARVSRP
jgi:DNA-binding transcriptional regulator YiaG